MAIFVRDEYSISRTYYFIMVLDAYDAKAQIHSVCGNTKYV